MKKKEGRSVKLDKWEKSKIGKKKKHTAKSRKGKRKKRKTRRGVISMSRQ